MEIRVATIEELEKWWDGEILKYPYNDAYKVWKEEFVTANKNGLRKTFFCLENNQYIGQGTLVLKNADPVMTGEGKAEIGKLEIIPEFRGKGIATKIYEGIAKFAKENGIRTLTIGVEPCEVHNMQVYFHWGFTNFLQVVTETYPPEKPGVDGETITVLCYSKII